MFAALVGIGLGVLAQKMMWVTVTTPAIIAAGLVSALILFAFGAYFLGFLVSNKLFADKQVE